MSAKQIKVATQLAFDELNKKNPAVFDEITTPNTVWHQTPVDIVGGEAYMQWLKGVFLTFPDIHFSLDDIVAEGDKVAFRYSWTGTFKGNWGKIAPTNKKVTHKVFAFQRYEKGRIAESWSTGDSSSMYRQMGITPPQI
jgi:predicted ester cyclase